MTDLTSPRAPNVRRLAMALIGAVAGLACWLFIDWFDAHHVATRAFWTLVSLVLGGFAVFMALAGPVNLRRAAVGAVGLGAVSALLVFVMLMRYPAGNVENFLPLHAVAYLVFLGVGTPFVSAALQASGGWRDYARLFSTAWSIVVRGTGALVFVGIAWVLIFLSNTLLELVGLDVIEQFIEIDGVGFALSGAFFGLAISILDELAEYISPYLVLRLFRILLPPLVCVVAIFLVALPLRGISDLFGNWSTAATMMTVAWAGVTLLTAVLDQDDAAQARSRVLLMSAQAMALMLVPLAGVAAYAVWLRVGAYGWTPDRLAAALIAGALVVYALCYAASILSRDAWGQRIRAVNRYVAMGKIAVAALWLSPVINAEAISSTSQLARFESGAVDLANVPLWELREEWGRAGQAAFARLGDLVAGDPEAETVYKFAQQAETRYALRRDVEEANLVDLGAVLPGLLWRVGGGPGLSELEISGLNWRQMEEVHQGCLREVAGHPGCAFYLAPMIEGAPDRGFVFLADVDGHVRVKTIEAGAANGTLTMPFGRDAYLPDSARVFGALRQGHAPSFVTIEVFEFGGERLWPALPK
ncbi:hypothetical protein ACS3SW_19225 [Roseobacteraceae bacterium S113]